MFLKVLKRDRQFTEERMQNIDVIYKQLEKQFPLTGLGISEKERLDIVKAIGLPQGHWYKCQNGKLDCFMLKYVSLTLESHIQLDMCHMFCKASLTQYAFFVFTTLYDTIGGFSILFYLKAKTVLSRLMSN